MDMYVIESMVSLGLDWDTPWNGVYWIEAGNIPVETK